VPAAKLRHISGTTMANMDNTHDVNDILDHLLVPSQDGSLVPASSLRSSQDSHGSKRRRITSTDTATKDNTTSSKTLGRFEPITEHESEERINPTQNQSVGMDAFVPPPSAQSQVMKVEYPETEKRPSPFADCASDASGNLMKTKWMDQDTTFAAHLQSIDDFDAEHPYQPKAKPLAPGGFEKADPLVLQQLHEACQSRGALIDYDIKQVGMQAFAGTVTFGGRVIQDDGPYPSKRHVKGALARRAWGNLQANPLPSKKRKSICLQEGSDERVSREILTSQNWVATLQRECNEALPSSFLLTTSQNTHSLVMAALCQTSPTAVARRSLAL
jgi:hypothetical protein